MKKIGYHIKLDSRLHECLQRQARHAGCSMSMLIICALRKEVGIDSPISINVKKQEK